MSESEVYGEREPQEKRVIERYYHDIYDPDLSRASLVVALDNLINDLPFDPVISMEELSKNCLYPTDYDLEQEPRIAREKLAILPIAHFGPKLDRSTVPLEELKQWYTDAARGMRLLTGKDHTKDCLELAHEEDLICAESALCPVQFLQRYLMDGVNPPDFSRLSYLEDSERAFSVAVKKMKVAVEQRIIEPLYSEGLLAAYTIEYCEIFGSGVQETSL